MTLNVILANGLSRAKVSITWESWWWKRFSMVTGTLILAVNRYLLLNPCWKGLCKVHHWHMPTHWLQCCGIGRCPPVPNHVSAVRRNWPPRANWNRRNCPRCDRLCWSRCCCGGVIPPLPHFPLSCYLRQRTGCFFSPSPRFWRGCQHHKSGREEEILDNSNLSQCINHVSRPSHRYKKRLLEKPVWVGFSTVTGAHGWRNLSPKNWDVVFWILSKGLFLQFGTPLNVTPWNWVKFTLVLVRNFPLISLSGRFSC